MLQGKITSEGMDQTKQAMTTVTFPLMKDYLSHFQSMNSTSKPVSVPDAGLKNENANAKPAENSSDDLSDLEKALKQQNRILFAVIGLLLLIVLIQFMFLIFWRKGSSTTGQEVYDEIISVNETMNSTINSTFNSIINSSEL